MKRVRLTFFLLFIAFTSILPKTKEYYRMPKRQRRIMESQLARRRRIRERENAINRIRVQTENQIREMGGPTEQVQQSVESNLSQVAALDPHYEINLFISKRPPERAARIFSRLILSMDGEDVSMMRILAEELTESEMNEVHQIIRSQSE